VIVPASLTWRELHEVLQISVGWSSYHLHMFDVEGVLAADKSQYIAGLTKFREDDIEGWISDFAAAAAQAAALADAYLGAVENVQDRWREELKSAIHLRADAAAWRIIEVLPAHPVLTLRVAAAAINRTKAVVNQALSHLEQAGVLVRLSEGERNRTWEAAGLLDLLAGLEGAQPLSGQ
jgi:hypothetical protein